MSAEPRHLHIDLAFDGNPPSQYAIKVESVAERIELAGRVGKALEAVFDTWMREQEAGKTQLGPEYVKMLQAERDEAVKMWGQLNDGRTATDAEIDAWMAKHEQAERESRGEA